MVVLRCFSVHPPRLFNTKKVLVFTVIANTIRYHTRRRFNGYFCRVRNMALSLLY